MRYIVAALALVLFAGCNQTSGAADASAASQPPAASAAPTPAPSQAPAAQAGFSVQGEPTQGGWLRGTAPSGTVSLSLNGKNLAVAANGAFFAAFDRDAPREAVLAARLADGSTLSHPIAVSARAWDIEHVNIPRRPGGPTEAFLKLRRPELARIGAARAKDTGARGWQQRFVWPVRGRLSGLFGSQRVYRGEPGSYHSGTDITTGSSGTPFVAPADGVVILAADQPFTLEGKLLMLDHGMGLNSAFLHCDELLVREGDVVRQGQVIGRIGMSGRATGPHLHWSMRWRDARLDPLLFAGPMR